MTLRSCRMGVCRPPAVPMSSTSVVGWGCGSACSKTSRGDRARRVSSSALDVKVRGLVEFAGGGWRSQRPQGAVFDELRSIIPKLAGVGHGSSYPR